MLDSLCTVADEILVVDSFSTDRTETICKSYPKVRFLQNKFEGYIEQKQFDIQQAKHDWILSLDGDECLSDELIKRLKASNKAPSRTTLHTRCRASITIAASGSVTAVGTQTVKSGSGINGSDAGEAPIPITRSCYKQAYKQNR